MAHAPASPVPRCRCLALLWDCPQKLMVHISRKVRCIHSMTVNASRNLSTVMSSRPRNKICLRGLRCEGDDGENAKCQMHTQCVARMCVCVCSVPCVLVCVWLKYEYVCNSNTGTAEAEQATRDAALFSQGGRRVRTVPAVVQSHWARSGRLQQPRCIHHEGCEPCAW